MNSKNIKAPRKEGFVLADFGEGFIPAAWDPSTKYWVVAEPREYRDGPGKALRSRGFDMYPILKTANKSMRAWVSIPSIVKMNENFKIIKQLVDALESAQGHLQYVLHFKPEDIEYDLTNIDDALSAGHDFLGDCKPMPPLMPPLLPKP